MRKILTAILLLCAAVAWPMQGAADTEPQVYFFWAASNEHSQNAHAFLRKAQTTDAKIRLRMFEVEESLFNAVLLVKVYERIGLPGLAWVPLIVIGKHVIIGYIDEETTGKEVLSRIAECRKVGCRDTMHDVIDGPSEASMPSLSGT